MHEKKLKATAVKAVVAMLTVMVFSFSTTKYSNMKLYASTVDGENELDASMEQGFVAGEAQEEQFVNLATGESVDFIGERYIKIAKMSSEPIKISVEDLYMERKIKITLNNLTQNIYSKDSFSFSEGEFAMEKIALETTYDPEAFTYSAVFNILMDTVYAQTIYEKNDGFYIELKNPKEVYDKILVIDAGHGGNDIGTYSKDKEYVEKDINQNVVTYLKELLDENQMIKTYYTKVMDQKVYLNPRVNLANDVKADLFLSIHCNGSEDMSAKGTEVLYGSSKNITGKITSKEFAQLAYEDLTEALGMKERGIIKKNDIYIIGKSEVPVALVELGFMSNLEDMKILRQKKVQKKAAESLYTTILRAFALMNEETE